MGPERLKPEGPEYERLAAEEIAHYTRIFLGDGESDAGRPARDKLLQPVPPSWVEIETRAADLVRERTGADLTGHVLSQLRRSQGVRMLSLGSGPGGIELALAREARDAAITCVDLNPALVQLGQHRASEEGLNIRFEAADLNAITLSKGEFNVVLCHASLHHVLELERLAGQIRDCLRDDGELIAVDVCSRNGYLMWPETRDVVHEIWKTLPPRFRINHTAYRKPQVDEEIWEADTSAASMECIRAEDILPLLSSTFRVKQLVPYFCLCRRFFDTMYGPNFDLTQPLDFSILNWVWQLDRYYIESNRLKPETFFGVYAR